MRSTRILQRLSTVPFRKIHLSTASRQFSGATPAYKEAKSERYARTAALAISSLTLGYAISTFASGNNDKNTHLKEKHFIEELKDKCFREEFLKDKYYSLCNELYSEKITNASHLAEAFRNDMGAELILKLRGSRLSQIIKNIDDLEIVLYALRDEAFRIKLFQTISPSHYQLLILNNSDWNKFQDTLEKHTISYCKGGYYGHEKLEKYKETVIQSMGLDHYEKITQGQTRGFKR